MEILKKLRVSRRFALKGAVGGIGVSLWLPILESMCNDDGTAFAQGEPIPTSFGVFFWGNGYHAEDWIGYPENWTGNGTGTGDNWQLPKNLEPFAQLKNDMTFVTGLDMMDGQFKGHGWGVVYVLAGGDGNVCTVTSDVDQYYPEHVYERAEATQYQPTIDQLIADAVHSNEPFKSLETGVLPYKGLNMGTVGDNLAHRGPNDFLPPERDPTKLFNKLFGTGAPGAPADISNALRRSVLDAVLEEANSLKKTVGSSDAKRIDSHMESIRTIELRLPVTEDGGAPQRNCTVPTAPPITLADMTAQSQALNRLIAAAVTCNLTRVYTHLWSGPRDDNAYPTIPISAAHHDLTHAGNTAEQSKIEHYIMSQYADLAQVMKDTPMAAGNVLDHTLIYGISEIPNPQWHVHTDYRIVLMGHAGGQVPGNRQVRLQGRKVTELMLTMQQLMGLEVTTFGSWDQTTRTMSEILA
jgi:hypothetical protein